MTLLPLCSIIIKKPTNVVASTTQSSHSGKTATKTAILLQAQKDIDAVFLQAQKDIDALLQEQWCYHDAPISTSRSKLTIYKVKTNDDELTKLLSLPLVVQPEIRVMGKVCRQRRNVGFFAKPGVPGYKYSGQQTTVIDISAHPILQKYLDIANQITGGGFNGVLVNLYEDGTNYISAHSDDEKGISKAGVASIAFGATRTFRIRDKQTSKIVIDVQHRPGQLMIMSGEFQKDYTHEIPIQKRVKEPRISLTFRKHH